MSEIKKCPSCGRTIRYIRTKNEFHCMYCPTVVSMEQYSILPVYNPMQMQKVSDMAMFNQPVSHKPIVGSGRY